VAMTSRIVASLVSLLVLLAPVPGHAEFFKAHIAEVMSGADGDPSVQYVEIRTYAAGQNNVANTRLTALSCDGSTSQVLLLLPSHMGSTAVDARWIMATTSFAAAAGITPDFTWDPAVTGSIPTPCGMICWGSPVDPTGVPPAPGTWAASDPNNYVDCVGYG